MHGADQGTSRLRLVVIGREPSAPWFCHECGTPYIWAKPDQIRRWIESKLKFDETLEEDVQLELIELLAVLTPNGSEDPNVISVGSVSSWWRRRSCTSRSSHFFHYSRTCCTTLDRSRSGVKAAVRQHLANRLWPAGVS